MTSKCPSLKVKPMDRRPSMVRLTREDLKQMFRDHDLDGDGRLSVQELRRAFGYLGAFIPIITAYAARLCADSDGDGYITENELDKLVDFVEQCNLSLIKAN